MRVTIGADPGTAEHIGLLGGRHVECPVDDFVEDEEQNVLTAPAYMLGPGIKEVAAGIERLVTRLIELA